MELQLENDGIFQNIERIYLPKWRSWLNCAIALIGRRPLQVAYYRSGKFHNRVRELMKLHDGSLTHLIRLGEAVKYLPGTKFLEMTDAISLNYNRISENRRSSKELMAQVYLFERKRLNAYELNIVEHFDHTFLVSDIDRNYLFSKYPKKMDHVTVASNGVSLNMMPYGFDLHGKDIIFIGNMYSLQNLDAAKYMASEILPLVRRARPETRLRLIGRIKSEQAAMLAEIDGVDVTGEVSSVASAARGGAVGVCPLRLGAGVQNKILEYMAIGLPVVSTSLGLEGFAAKNGNELVIADNVEDFACEVIRLLDDRIFASSIAEAGRRYVEEQHSWDTMLAPMLRVIRESL
jgi:glycosyltransferase involved in cell wall biosynthesis